MSKGKQPSSLAKVLKKKFSEKEKLYFKIYWQVGLEAAIF